MSDPTSLGNSPGNSNRLLQNTLAVSAGNDKFEFRIASLSDEIAIGARIAKIRRSLDPEWNGFDQGLDGSTMFYLRAAATFELQLAQSSAKWPFSEGKTGKIVVDSSQFPSDKVNTVMEAYQGYIAALDTFRSGRNPAGAAVGKEALAPEPAAQ